MTSAESVASSVLAVVAMLAAVPLVMMGIVMPLVGLTGGHGAAGPVILFPVIPLVVLVGVGYVLYTVVGGKSGQAPDGQLGELRSAYVRGDLSEAEFEQRRDRLRALDHQPDGSEVSARD